MSPIFENPEIHVTFPADGYISKSVTPAKTQDYFAQYTTHLKFCRQPTLPSYVQQVRSEDGWLCHFYVLPVLDKAKIKDAILKRDDRHTEITYQKKKGIGEEAINGQPMLVWREQSGKTRLDHFLVLSHQHHYLWVSSPYGDGERMREILKTLQFKP